LGLGHKVDDLTVHKKIVVTKSKEVKTGRDLAESFKEGCGSRRAVFPVILMMMMM
jgi:hypothetical protein